MASHPILAIKPKIYSRISPSLNCLLRWRTCRLWKRAAAIVKRDVSIYLHFLIGNLACKTTPPYVFIIRNYRYFSVLGL